ACRQAPTVTWCQRIAGSRGYSVPVAFAEIAVSVHAAVAQVRPDASHRLATAGIHVDHQHGFLVAAGPGQEFTLRATDEAVAPELNAIATVRAGLEAGAVG